MMIGKKQSKTLDPTIYENLHRVPCPNCTATDLHSKDGDNINCRNCEGSWTPQAFAQLLAKEAKG